MASVINDGPLFFPNVVSTQEFQQTGILFGSEAYGSSGLNWVVIDPGRYDLQVWGKPEVEDDFVKAGTNLGAAFFNNGPFVDWRISLVAGSVMPAVYGFIASIVNLFDHDEAKKYLAGKLLVFEAIGKLQGKKRNVSRQGKEAPNGVHFGKTDPGLFANHTIATGDAPVGMDEAVSGLLWCVKGYLAQPPVPPNLLCNWGLADFEINGPLGGLPPMQGAIRDYNDFQQQQEQDVPPGLSPPTPPALTGVLFCCTYTGPPLNTTLAGILIRDAVFIDGSDSVLFGHGSTVLVGDSMSLEKRVGMNWGYCVFPR